MVLYSLTEAPFGLTSRIFCIIGFVFPMNLPYCVLTNYFQVLNGAFAKDFAKIEPDLEKEGPQNPLDVLYKKSQSSELGLAEARVRERLGIAKR
jgi:hypothetical protein